MRDDAGFQKALPFKRMRDIFVLVAKGRKVNEKKIQIHVRFSLGKMTELTAISLFLQIPWTEYGEESRDFEIIIAQNRGQA